MVEALLIESARNTRAIGTPSTFLSVLSRWDRCLRSTGERYIGFTPIALAAAIDIWLPRRASDSFVTLNPRYSPGSKIGSRREAALTRSLSMRYYTLSSGNFTLRRLPGKQLNVIDSPITCLLSSFLSSFLVTLLASRCAVFCWHVISRLLTLLPFHNNTSAFSGISRLFSQNIRDYSARSSGEWKTSRK